MRECVVIQGRFDQVLNHIGDPKDFLSSMTSAEYFDQISKDMDRTAYFNPHDRGDIEFIKELTPQIEHLITSDDKLEPLCFTQGQFAGCVMSPMIQLAMHRYDEMNKTEISHQFLMVPPAKSIFGTLDFSYLDDQEEKDVAGLSGFEITTIPSFMSTVSPDQEDPSLNSIQGETWFSVSILKNATQTPAKRDLTLILHRELYDELIKQRKTIPNITPQKNNVTVKKIAFNQIISSIEQFANSSGLIQLLESNRLFTGEGVDIERFKRLKDRFSGNANLDHREVKIPEFEALLTQVKELTQFEPLIQRELTEYMESAIHDINFFEDSPYDRVKQRLDKLFTEYHEDTLTDESPGDDESPVEPDTHSDSANRNPSPQPDTTQPKWLHEATHSIIKKPLLASQKKIALLILYILIPLSIFSILLFTIPAIAVWTLTLKLITDILGSSIVFAAAYLADKRYRQYVESKESNISIMAETATDYSDTNRIVMQQLQDAAGGVTPETHEQDKQHEGQPQPKANTKRQGDAEPQPQPQSQVNHCALIFKQLNQLINPDHPSSEYSRKTRQPNLVESLKVAAEALEPPNKIDNLVKNIRSKIAEQSVNLQPVMLGRLKDALEELDEQYFDNKSRILAALDQLIQPQPTQILNRKHVEPINWRDSRGNAGGHSSSKRDNILDSVSEDIARLEALEKNALNFPFGRRG